MYSHIYQPNNDMLKAYRKQIKKEKAKRFLKKILIIMSMLLIMALFCFKTVNKVVEKKQQQKKINFNKRKNKELKTEKHQEKVRTDKREKIMKKLNNQARQDALKKQAQIKGLFTPTEIDKELMQAFRYNKLNWKKYFINYFTDKKHPLIKVKVQGLYEFRFKKEEYLSKKQDYLLWLKKKLKNNFSKVVKRFNYTMDRYVKKYNDNRFNNYKIKE